MHLSADRDTYKKN